MGRRWRVAIGLPVAAAVMTAAAGWFVWLPNYRPALRHGERYGIDVSAHQGRIDWSKVARNHVAFAYIKATEGADFTDRRFADN